MKTEYYLGCSGFYYNHWKGRFYPEKLAKTKSKLQQQSSGIRQNKPYSTQYGLTPVPNDN
jgi:hypothetical protein